MASNFPSGQRQFGISLSPLQDKHVVPELHVAHLYKQDKQFVAKVSYLPLGQMQFGGFIRFPLHVRQLLPVPEHVEHTKLQA